MTSINLIGGFNSLCCLRERRARFLIKTEKNQSPKMPKIAAHTYFQVRAVLGPFMPYEYCLDSCSIAFHATSTSA